MRSFQAPTGTRDFVAPESGRWQQLIARFASLAGLSGYGLVVGPMFEDLEVFQRVGESTDVVRKEMYDFEDKGGRRLALRPEGTASIVRAWVQHRPALPWKTWYAAPSFRYERPQAGRYRQHHQLGLEVLGSADPEVDVEIMALAQDLYRGIGLRRIVLALNSIGDPVCRPAYLEKLREFLAERSDHLCREHRDRAAVHPLRVLDCKRSECREATGAAPRITDHLCDACAGHFAKVQAGLEAMEVPFVLDTRLVRGFDY
ncbi:MAG: histidine--tRNA ligase, partial [Acidimicrobiales bacterium]